MKNRRILTFLGIFALGGALYAGAQDYDDIYYDASKTVKNETVKKSGSSVSLTEQTQPRTVSTRVGQSTVTPVTGTTSRVRVEREGVRDDDEYNRRGAYDPSTLNDTTYIDDEGSFSNTQRIERFYNPDIIITSNDDELITLYYEDQPTVNLIIGSNWGPSWGWGWSSIYYDPWYSSYPWGWYQWNGWYGPSWYYMHYGWHHGLYGWGYWNSWAYRPWGYGWGYHYGWNHWGYGHYGYHNWDRGWRRSHGGIDHANGRRPSSIGRGYGYNRGGTGTSGVRSNSGIGRRPSNGGIINSDRPSTRPGVRYSNGTNYGGIRGGSGTVGGHRSPSTGNVGTSSGIGRSTRPSSTPSRSYTGGSSSSGRSYGSGSSSSGRSYSGGSSSGRSYTGGSNIGGGRSGGYSGGGGHSGGYSGGGRSGGGGGGHRR
jgi:hypothetical protein